MPTSCRRTYITQLSEGGDRRQGGGAGGGYRGAFPVQANTHTIDRKAFERCGPLLRAWRCPQKSACQHLALQRTSFGPSLRPPLAARPHRDDNCIIDALPDRPDPAQSGAQPFPAASALQNIRCGLAYSPV